MGGYTVEALRETGMYNVRGIIDVKEDIDLAAIMVPAEILPGVLEDCVKKGVKGAIIFSAGFKEIGCPADSLPGPDDHYQFDCSESTRIWY
jgi:acyl-CoA synthetase (NDP forming)